MKKLFVLLMLLSVSCKKESVCWNCDCTYSREILYANGTVYNKSAYPTPFSKILCKTDSINKYRNTYTYMIIPKDGALSSRITRTCDCNGL